MLQRPVEPKNRNAPLEDPPSGRRYTPEEKKEFSEAITRVYEAIPIKGEQSPGNLPLVERAMDLATALLRLPPELIAVSSGAAPLAEEVAHPAVVQAGVLGRPDSRLGEEVIAFVSLRPDAQATASELTEHARRHLAATKYPREIRIVPAVPLTSVGKLDRKKLRQWVADGDGQTGS